MTETQLSNPPGELYCTACERTFQVGDRCPDDGTRLLRLKTRIDPFLGRDLDGRYTVLEKLGQGGMGAVYRAEQHSVDREVAIKVVNTSLVSDADVIKRFLREAKLASKLAHPNAVGVLDFGQTEDGVFYLVMELVTGRPLDAVLKADGVFKPERVVRIGTQVCDALDGAHALSIVHRDLKPSNVMLLSQGRDLVKVLDFGLAKSTATDTSMATMTNAGAVVGTPAFMPPELATGMPVDGRADLYSLGCMLYLLGTGRLPFHSESVHELMSMHASDDPAPPMSGVPRRLALVVAKLLEKNPANRYQTAAEALHALDQSLVLATPPPGAFVDDRDTFPSIGPFPATTHQFAHLQSPRAPSEPPEDAVDDPRRRKPSPTAVERLMSAETLLPPTGAPVPALSQPGTGGLASGLDAMPVRSSRRLPLLVLGAGALVVAIAAIVLVTRDGAPPAGAPLAAPATDLPSTPPGVTPPVAATLPAEPRPATPLDAAVPPVATGSAAPVDPVTVTTPRPTPLRPTPPKPGRPGRPGGSTTTAAGSGAPPITPPPAVTPPTPKVTPPGAGSGAGSAAKLPF